MTKEEFVSWRENTTTLEVFEQLRQIRQQYVDQLTSGWTLDSLADTARAVGRVEAFDYLLNIEWEDET